MTSAFALANQSPKPLRAQARSPLTFQRGDAEDALHPLLGAAAQDSGDDREHDPDRRHAEAQRPRLAGAPPRPRRRRAAGPATARAIPVAGSAQRLRLPAAGRSGSTGPPQWMQRLVPGTCVTRQLGHQASGGSRRQHEELQRRGGQQPAHLQAEAQHAVVVGDRLRASSISNHSSAVDSSLAKIVCPGAATSTKRTSW